MHLASWTLLLIFVMIAVQGYDDESVLERLTAAAVEAAEEEEDLETKARPHQQREGWRGGGGRATLSSSAADPPAPSLPPESIRWKEDDYDSETELSLRRGRGRGGASPAAAAGSSRRSPSSYAVTAAGAEQRRAPLLSSRPASNHLLPSAAPADDDRVRQTRRHKTSQRVRLNGSRGLVAHSVCPSQTEWKRLREARDINNTVVEVFQPGHGGQRKRGDGGGGGGVGGSRWTQWFYMVSCRNQVFQSQRHCQDCCIGIDHSRYSSSCEQRQAFVLAYIRRPWQKRFVWDYILINSGCNCAITSLHEDL